jgi:hypothetical protein
MIEEALRKQAAEIALAGHKGWGNTMTDAEKEINNLRAQLAEAKKDAERYRWLRSRFDACAASCNFAQDDAGNMWRNVEQNLGAGLILDAQIDAAQKEQP